MFIPVFCTLFAELFRQISRKNIAQRIQEIIPVFSIWPRVWAIIFYKHNMGFLSTHQHFLKVSRAGTLWSPRFRTIYDLLHENKLEQLRKRYTSSSPLRPFSVYAAHWQISKYLWSGSNFPWHSQHARSHYHCFKQVNKTIFLFPYISLLWLLCHEWLS